MGFSQLLGNSRLKKNLCAGISRGRVSHFYLISGPVGAGKRTLARLLSAAVLCKNAEKPCMQCAACRKVLADTHPDVITVTDPEHKNIPVDMVRNVREQMFVRPNEADKKIYIFAQSMGVEGQNALLKILEEPPSYGVFILISENPEKLLPTIRSRATELRLQALDADLLKKVLEEKFPDADSRNLQMAIARSGGYLGQAQAILEQGQMQSPQTEAFAAGFFQKQPLEMLRLLTSMEKWDREKLIKELTRWKELLQQALFCRSGVGTMSEQEARLWSLRGAAELMQAIRSINKGIEYAQGNVSVAAICGYLVWALR